jgi:hypothetical protein
MTNSLSEPVPITQRGEPIVEIMRTPEVEPSDGVRLLSVDKILSDDNDLIIPQYISKNALYSACFCVFPNCIVTYIFGYERMCATFVLLYISTMLYWYKAKRNGIIRIFDMCLAYYTMYRVTFVERLRLHPVYQTYWMYVFYTIVIAFLCNDYVFYMQVKRGFSNDNNVYTEYTQWPLKLLNYTQPNTKERENANYISMYIHIFFVHLLPTITFTSFIILSYYATNLDSFTCDNIAL